jgi:hypothetical protein
MWMDGFASIIAYYPCRRDDAPWCVCHACRYPLALEAGRILAAAAGDAALADSCERDRDAASAENVAALFIDDDDDGGGGYFAYGAALDGSGRADDLMFGGQAAGQMLARHAGWGDVAAPFAATQSALRAQLQRQVAPSLSFYAPKVFNLTTDSRARDVRNGSPSSTWPFYLESYTAIAALQAGFAVDALALVQQVQLVNARLGLTWSQNLWNPGSITYVAAPVSWFLPDVLAGVALDVPARTLWVSPLVLPPAGGPAGAGAGPAGPAGAAAAPAGSDGGNDTAVIWPVFLPQMWLSVSATRSGGGGGGGRGRGRGDHGGGRSDGKGGGGGGGGGVGGSGSGGSGGTLTVTVTRSFGDVAGGATPVIETVAAAPLGTPAAAAQRVALVAPWTASEGAVLDLSEFFDLLVAPELQPRVLPAVPP